MPLNYSDLLKSGLLGGSAPIIQSRQQDIVAAARNTAFNNLSSVYAQAAQAAMGSGGAPSIAQGQSSDSESLDPRRFDPTFSVNAEAEKARMGSGGSSQSDEQLKQLQVKAADIAVKTANDKFTWERGLSNAAMTGDIDGYMKLLYSRPETQQQALEMASSVDSINNRTSSTTLDRRLTMNQDLGTIATQVISAPEDQRDSLWLAAKAGLEEKYPELKGSLPSTPNSATLEGMTMLGKQRPQGEEKFKWEQQLKGDFDKKAEPYKQFILEYNTVIKPSKDNPMASAIADKALLFKTARFLQGSGVLSNQDVAAFDTPGGFENVMQKMSAYYFNNRNMSDVTRQELIGIWDKQLPTMEQNLNQLRSDYTKQFQTYGLNADVLGDAGQSAALKAQVAKDHPDWSQAKINQFVDVELPKRDAAKNGNIDQSGDILRNINAGGSANAGQPYNTNAAQVEKIMQDNGIPLYTNVGNSKPEVNKKNKSGFPGVNGNFAAPAVKPSGTTLNKGTK